MVLKYKQVWGPAVLSCMLGGGTVTLSSVLAKGVLFLASKIEGGIGGLHIHLGLRRGGAALQGGRGRG